MLKKVYMLAKIFLKLLGKSIKLNTGQSVGGCKTLEPVEVHIQQP